MNGLVIRSWPMLEPAPWPQMKPTSSPSGSSFVVIELISVAWLPPGRSVRPTEPANRTSPTWAKRNSLLKNTTLPGEWPGQCRMSKVSSPIETLSPSSSQRSGPKLRTPVMPKRAPLETTLSSRYLSAICGPSIGTFSASRKFGGAADMVDMAVGQPDLLDRDAGLLDRRQDLRHVAAGVDHDGLLGRLVPDDGAVLLEQRHRNDDRAGLRLWSRFCHPWGHHILPRHAVNTRGECRAT